MAEAAAIRGTVLVVDDTPDTLAVLTEALEREGYATLVATGGEAALAVCARVTPDLVLMDAMMPGLDGFESCRRFKATPSLAHVPVVFMTALSDTEHVVRGLAAGGVDYVAKPIVFDELFARIRVHLGNARAAHSARAALDATGGHLCATSGAGALLWCTPQAGDLLDEALGQRDALPEAVRLAVARAVAAGAGAAAVRLQGIEAGGPLHLVPLGSAGPGEFLFRLTRVEADEDALRRRFGLTTREAEVLAWVARGKANRDIGDILALSPRTVNKHLEVIFRKLGVENRASAAVLASRALGGGER